MNNTRNPEAGFTLIEALVAMAVLAVSAMTLLAASERHVAQTRGLSERVLARWVAENEIAAAQLGLDALLEWQSALGQRIETQTGYRTLPDSGLVEINVAAGPPGETLVTITAYLPNQEKP